MRRFEIAAPVAAWVVVALAGAPASALNHLWHVKEIFSNADGTVQFIELFNSSANEQFVGGQTLRANSDGMIRNFTISGNLSTPPSTANTHILIATPMFDSLTGAVAPNYTLPDPSISGPFFDPNATSITISFLASGDALTFAGSLLPKDGFQSLTDTNATGNPALSTPNITVTDNSPTRFPNTAGQIDLRPPPPPMTTGDYNGNGIVDAADYTTWRDTLGQLVSTAGDGADGTGPEGTPDGVIDQLDYQFWKDRFGDVVPDGGAGAAVASVAVPEPAGPPLLLGALITAATRRSRRVARRECP